VIHVFGSPRPPVARLTQALAARGHQLTANGPAGDGPATLVLGAGTVLDPAALGVLLGAWSRAPAARVLVVTMLGSHRDARAAALRAMWDLEETVRALPLPSLVCRLAPLVGPESPLWLRLRARPRLPDRGRTLVQPVAEDDVVETLDRALRDPRPWDGWYEIAGHEVLTLAELAALAARSGPPLPGNAGAWEPPVAELVEHRIAEPEPWIARFGIRPAPVTERCAAWAA
jgi:uncharacterized protein YbjT (DUF2867 family)